MFVFLRNADKSNNILLDEAMLERLKGYFRPIDHDELLRYI
jgi:hypothetical protein